MKIFIPSILAPALLCPALALAIAPATSEEVFCDSSHVVVGTVVKATPVDCRIDAKLAGKAILSCVPTNIVGLVVQVSEVLGRRNEASYYPGEAGIDVRDPLELTSSLLGTPTYPSAEDNGNIAVDLPPNGPVRRETISKAFDGQQFIFALHVNPSDIGSSRQRRKTYHAGVWRLAKREWIVGLLKGSDGISCPKLVTP